MIADGIQPATLVHLVGQVEAIALVDHQHVHLVGLSLEGVPVVDLLLQDLLGLSIGQHFTLFEGLVLHVLHGEGFVGSLFHGQQEVHVQLERDLVLQVDHVQTQVTVMVIALAEHQ